VENWKSIRKNEVIGENDNLQVWKGILKETALHLLKEMQSLS
jgi:hypothetical protein